MFGEDPPSFAAMFEIFGAMPRLQLAFLALAAVTWLVGANVLVAFHYRRLGKPAWSGFRPFAFPFKNFNAREWLILVVLMVISLTFGGIAIFMNPN